MYGGAVSIEAAASAAELRNTLNEQAGQLEILISRFTRARQLLPGRSDGWHGLAQLFYDWALASLESDLSAAEDQLTTALRQTRRALETMDNRVG